MVTRKVDDLMCLLQCKFRRFMNMEMRHPDCGSRDDKILIYIIRANLDALWTRKPNTVCKKFLEIRTVIKDSDELNMTPPLPEREPMAL